MPRELERQMRRRAETIGPQPPAALDPTQSQATESDDPGAQQRRRLKIGERLGDRIDEALRRHDVVGIATVHRVTREGGVLAEIFFACPTVAASFARAMQPRD